MRECRGAVGKCGGRGGLWRGSWAAVALAALVLALPGCSAFSGRSETAGEALFRDEPDIRVRVKRNVESITIDAPGAVMLRAVGADPVTLKTPVTVRVSARALQAEDAGGDSASFPYGATVEVEPIVEALAMLPAAWHPRGQPEGEPAPAPAPDAAVGVDGVKLPGVVMLRPRWEDSSTQLDVIARMPIEIYLPGVLVGELWASWPAETFRAQAVAARTYALFERERARGIKQPFDVESTTADQVFTGLTRNPVATRAAEQTRGMVVTWRGRLLKTYYSSTCGGRPASAADIWPTGAGFEYNREDPIQGRPREPYCQTSPFFRWELMRPDEDVHERLRAWGAVNGHPVRSMARLRSATPDRRNKAGRPIDFTLIDERGEKYTIGAEQLRSACNFPVDGLPPITRETRVPSGDMEVTPWADQVKFKGQGFGHGAGMCQWCAKGYAERGIPWSEMMARFYPGAKLTKAY